MKTLKLIFRIILWFLAGFLLFVLGYLFLSWLLPKIPVNTDYVEPEKGIDIYVTSNGVHTDFIVPSQNSMMNWEDVILRKDFPGADSSYHWISFGWGDKGFYLETPTWAELKFSVAFKASFYLSTTAMHVAYEKQEPFGKDYVKKIRITGEQYKTLVHYITQSFQFTPEGKIILLPNHGYWENDRFYEAIGSYGFAKTCNVWTNCGLKAMHIKTGFWSPFQGGLIDNLQQLK
jgi:uncharacterized protein (TIGR02117 family)